MKTKILKLSCITFSGLMLSTGNLAIAQVNVPVSNSVTTVTTNTAVTTDTAMTTVTPVTTVTTVTPNTPVTSITSVTTNTPVTTVTTNSSLMADPTMPTNSSLTKDASITSSDGTVNLLGPDTLVVRSTESTDSVIYSYTKMTTYVDENGNPVSVDTVKTGIPVTVYYMMDGDKKIATKVIIKKAKLTN